MLNRRGFFGAIAALFAAPFLPQRMDPWVKANPALFDGGLPPPDYLNEFRYRLTFVMKDGREIDVGPWLGPTFTVNQSTGSP